MSKSWFKKSGSMTNLYQSDHILVLVPIITIGMYQFDNRQVNQYKLVFKRLDASFDEVTKSMKWWKLQTKEKEDEEEVEPDMRTKRVAKASANSPSSSAASILSV